MERNSEVWNNFKSIQTHMDVFMERHPGVVRHAVKVKDAEKTNEPFKLTSADTRHYLFQDSQGRDHYDRLWLDGERQTITIIENNKATVSDRDLMIKTDLDLADSSQNDHMQKITSFTERMLEKYENSLEQNTPKNEKRNKRTRTNSKQQKNQLEM